MGAAGGLDVPVAEGARELADLLLRATHAVVLTGAGASTESGLPDFRSPGGLWQGVDPMRVASIWALRQSPVDFYRFYRHRLAGMGSARPNPCHDALAALEGMGVVKAVITQNVDGLHQAAGSRRVIEVHGSLREAACVDCGRTHPREALEVPVESEADLPRCTCGGLLKPNVILFGEALPEAAFSQAAAEAALCDLMVVVGSSLEVSPANSLPRYALSRGAELALVNLSETSFDRFARVVVRAKAGEVMPRVVEMVRTGRQG